MSVELIGKKHINVSEEYTKLLEGNGRLLTNMDEFKAAGLEYADTGSYTQYPINGSPSSKYYKFWKEQEKRCKEGYHTGYDYIPGYYYWYLNFSPILQTLELGDKDKDSGFIKSERIKDFPKVWDGDYYWYHYLNEAELSGRHAIGLKTRGRGFSFKGGSMLSRNFHLYPNSNNYALASDKKYLSAGDGILTKAWDNLDFIATATPWGKKRHYKDQDLHKRASYQKTVGGQKKEWGYKSNIIGISLKDDPDKHRGIRGKLILWEEGGSFPHLLKAWNTAIPSMRQGRSVFGMMVLFGTGGEEGDDIYGLSEIFRNPNTYEAHGIKNILDESRYGAINGFFAPEQVNREGFYDVNGNSFVKDALEDINKERAKKMEGNPDPDNIIRVKAEAPTKPEEAMINTNYNSFPVNDAMMRRAEIETSPDKFIDTEWIGDLKLCDEGVEWKRNTSLVPIRNYPLKNKSNRQGAIQIFEPPIKSKRTGKVTEDVYIAGIDPYDLDDGGSLGSIFILNLMTDRIVAEYTGRPATANEFYEICRRMLIYYNATANYENNLKGIFTYFEKKNSEHLLCETPSLLQDVIKSENTISRKFGTPGTVAVNKRARQYINNWLRKECIDNPDKTNVYRIRSIALLQEIEHWNPGGNFDRISSLGMLMIYREEFNREDIDIDKERDTSTINKIRSSGIGQSFAGNSYNRDIINQLDKTFNR